MVMKALCVSEDLGRVWDIPGGFMGGSIVLEMPSMMM